LLGDTIKIWNVFILCVIIGMTAVTVVSAKGEYTVNSDTEATLASAKDKPIVSPWTEGSLSTGNLIYTPLSIQNIVQGQTINHYVNVGSGVSWLEVDLNWGAPGNSLALTPYTPSGASLGTFHDSYDGSVNGQIHMDIYPSQGYIQQGTWRFKVYGESVSGTQSYTFNVYGHYA
jgi:hypothetical protein